MIYPRARAPLTEVVHAAANARAERWKQRTITARAERDALQQRLDDLEDSDG